MIVSEYDKLPWTAIEFRRWWRQVANACGIPKSIRNTDGRVRHATANDDDESEGEQVFESRG